MADDVTSDVAAALPFEADQDEESTTFSIPLLHDDLSSGQLGHHAYKNLNESSPRELVTARSVPHTYYFHARCRRPVYGVFTSDDTSPAKDLPIPAALIVLDFAFQQRADSARFKKAVIELEFYDSETVLLNPHSSHSAFDAASQPVILQFEPHDFQGPVETALGQTTKGLALSVSDPTNTVSCGPTWSKTKPFAVEGSFTVTGVSENDPPSKICWVIREDKLKKNGIRHTMSVCAIVSYVPGRRFAAKLRIRADVAFQVVKPVAGEKDDPLYFDSKKDTPHNHVLARDIKPLTRLDIIGGTWRA